jgi:hypothetical protein
MIINNNIFAKENSGAKLLVVDSNTYKKIDDLKILDGGINKKLLIKSSRLDNESLKKYYPAFSAFEGKTCNLLNGVKIINRPDDILYSTSKITNEDDIKKEVKKIKLLQILNDSNQDTNFFSKLDKNRIKSIGILCDGNLILRGKVYRKNSSIGNLKIKDINIKNNFLFLEEK